MVIITEWVSNAQSEAYRNVLDNTGWFDYIIQWNPTWKLWNTKVLDANLQPHTDIQHLVPERKVYPKSS